MTQNYLKYVTVSKSTLWQLSGARLCPDWDLLRTFLCTTRTGSRCTIVQNSVVFLSNFRAFRCFCPHVRPHLRAHKYLNPDKEDYSDVCPAINISTAGILCSTDNTHSTDFSAMHCHWQIQNVKGTNSLCKCVSWPLNLTAFECVAVIIVTKQYCPACSIMSCTVYSESGHCTLYSTVLQAALQWGDLRSLARWLMSDGCQELELINLKSL